MLFTEQQEQVPLSLPVIITAFAILIGLFSFGGVPLPQLLFVLRFFQILLDSLEHGVLHQPLTEPDQFSILRLPSVLLTDFALVSGEGEAAKLAHGPGFPGGHPTGRLRLIRVCLAAACS